MKTVVLLASIALATVAWADSTIDPDAAFAWAGNVGEFNWRPSLADGVVTGEYVCSGVIWAANAGWINMGSGTPANGIRYANTDGADSGVNVLADGALRGLAWGANIGWINFEPTGNPRIDLASGKLTGFAWSANAGWLTLSADGERRVATTSVPSGVDSDSDGITDAWELDHAIDLDRFTIDGDADGDGIPDLAEYAADTDPLDAQNALRITDFIVTDGGTIVTLTWTSRLSRRYVIQTVDNLATDSWDDDTSDPITADSDQTTMRTLSEPPANQRFYRIRVLRPLAAP